MKKILLITSLFLLTFTGYCQFTVNVHVEGPCVYPQENTFYWANVKVYLGTTLLADEFGTSSTEDIEVIIPEFCISDDSPEYSIVVDAMKAYITPFDRICKGTTINPYLFSCENFVNDETDQYVVME